MNINVTQLPASNLTSNVIFWFARQPHLNSLFEAVSNWIQSTHQEIWKQSIGELFRWDTLLLKLDSYSTRARKWRLKLCPESPFRLLSLSLPLFLQSSSSTPTPTPTPTSRQPPAGVKWIRNRNWSIIGAKFERQSNLATSSNVSFCETLYFHSFSLVNQWQQQQQPLLFEVDQQTRPKPAIWESNVAFNSSGRRPTPVEFGHLRRSIGHTRITNK